MDCADHHLQLSPTLVDAAENHREVLSEPVVADRSIVQDPLDQIRLSERPKPNFTHRSGRTPGHEAHQ